MSTTLKHPVTPAPAPDASALRCIDAPVDQPARRHEHPGLRHRKIMTARARIRSGFYDDPAVLDHAIRRMLDLS